MLDWIYRMPIKQRPERIFFSPLSRWMIDPRSSERLSLLLLGKALYRQSHHVITCLGPREERQREAERAL